MRNARLPRLRLRQTRPQVPTGQSYVKGNPLVALHPENYISLYSGGGGLDLGFRLENPSARPLCYVERELEAAALLVDHIEAGKLEPAPIWSDARTLDCEPFVGRVDWLIGGPPCQPFSKAGKHLGAEDPRNQWPTTLGLVSDIAPKFCFFENVPSTDFVWYVYEEVEPCFRELGYSVEVGLFSAIEVGATQTRERIFIMARSKDSDRGRSEESNNTGGRAQEVGRSSRELACPDRESINSSKWSTRNEFERGGRAFPPGRESWSEWITYLGDRPDLSPASESGLRRGADGVARSMDGLSRVARLRILGNGVVPATAARAFRELKGRLNQERCYERA